MKLIKPRCHLDIRKYSFAHRIVGTVLMIILLHVIQSTGSSAKLTGFCMVKGLYKLYQASFPHKYYIIHIVNHTRKLVLGDSTVKR